MDIHHEITYMDDVVEKGNRFVDGVLSTTYVRYWQLRPGPAQFDAHYRDWLHTRKFSTINYSYFKKGTTMNTQTIDQQMVEAEVIKFDADGNPIVPKFENGGDVVETFVQTEETIN